MCGAVVRAAFAAIGSGGDAIASALGIFAWQPAPNEMHSKTSQTPSQVVIPAFLVTTAVLRRTHAPTGRGRFGSRSTRDPTKGKR